MNKSLNNKVVLGARVLLGLLFVVFGINFFFPFLTQPPAPEAGAKFLGALFETGYIFPVIKTIEVATGILLILGIAVPFALVLLAPIVVNIVLYHTILAPPPVLPAVIVILGLFVAWNYRGNFKPLFSSRFDDEGRKQ